MNQKIDITLKHHAIGTVTLRGVQARHYAGVTAVGCPKLTLSCAESIVKEIEYAPYHFYAKKVDEEWAGYCNEFPSLSWIEPTKEKALVGIIKLVKAVIADIQKQNLRRQQAEAKQ